jgi:putative membrane protein
MTSTFISYRFHLLLFAGLTLIFLWSAIEPADRFTWVLEVLPAVIGVIVLMVTIRRFPLTDLLYVLIWLHAVILLVGGHYTYAEVPLFNWLRDSFDLQRNYYDRVGHFAQGFVPAMIAREILLRTSPLKAGKWLFFLVTCICLAISAGYEFVEWWVAVGTGSAAEAFLGTQGDVWDTQWDMFLAFCGAVVAQLMLSRCHDRQLQGRGFIRRGSVRHGRV